MAFDTSSPELIVNLVASSQRDPKIVLDHVIGTNNFYLFVILGIVGLISPS